MCSAHINAGLVLQDGVEVYMESTSFSGASVAAIDVCGRNCRLRGDACSIFGTSESLPTNETAENCKYKGLVVGVGASIAVTNTTIHDVGTGVHMVGSRVSLVSCTVSNASLACVNAQKHSELDMKDCSVERAQGEEQGHGVLVDFNSKAELYTSVFQHNKGGGLGVLHNSDVIVEGCTFANNELAGIHVQNSGVIVTKSDIHDCPAGAELLNVTSSTLKSTNFSKCSTCVFAPSASSPVRILNCSFKTFNVVAVCARQCEVHMEDVQISSTIKKAALGISLDQGAHLSLKSSSIDTGHKSLGLRVHGDGVKATIQDCSITASTGVQVSLGAVVKFIHLKTSKCDTAVGVNNGARVQFTNWCSIGDTYPLQCTEGFVELESCQLLDFEAGIQFNGNGKQYIRSCKLVGKKNAPLDKRIRSEVYVADGRYALIIEKTQFKSTTGSSVKICSSRATLSFHDCAVIGSGHHGVQLARGGSKGTVTGCRFKDNREYAVHANDGAQLVVEKTHCTGNKQGAYCLLGSGSIRLSECSSDQDGTAVSIVGGADRNHDPSIPRATLSHVLVRRSTYVGYSFINIIKLCMRNCVALQSHVFGIEVRGCHDEQPGLSASAFDSVFQGSGYAGVIGTGGGSLSFKNVLCRRNKGPGFVVAQTGSQMRLTQCESFKNKRAYECDQEALMERSECKPNVAVASLKRATSKYLVDQFSWRNVRNLNLEGMDMDNLRRVM